MALIASQSTSRINLAIKPKATYLTSRVRYPIYLDLIHGENTNIELSLIDIGGDLDCHRMSIYLHIIWYPDDGEDGYLP